MAKPTLSAGNKATSWQFSPLPGNFVSWGICVQSVQSNFPYSTAWNHMHIGTCEPQGQNACIAHGRNETKPCGSWTKPVWFTRENLGSKFISVKWMKWRHKRIVLAIVFLLFSFEWFFPHIYNLQTAEHETICKFLATGSSGIAGKCCLALRRSLTKLN